MSFNSIRDSFLENAALNHAFKAELKQPDDAVTYDGNSWTVGDKTFAETPEKLSLLKRIDAHLYHFFMSFSPKYKKVFEATVQKFENAKLDFQKELTAGQKLFANQAFKAMKVSSDLLSVKKDLEGEHQQLENLQKDLDNLQVEKKQLLEKQTPQIATATQELTQAFLEKDKLSEYISDKKALEAEKNEHETHRSRLDKVKNFLYFADKKGIEIKKKIEDIDDLNPDYKGKSINDLETQLQNIEAGIVEKQKFLDESTPEGPFKVLNLVILQKEAQIQTQKARIKDIETKQKETQQLLQKMPAELLEKVPDEVKEFLNIPKAEGDNPQIQGNEMPAQRTGATGAVAQAAAPASILNPATLQFLQQLERQSNKDTREIWEALLLNAAKAHGKDLVVATTVKGNEFSFTLSEKLMMWLDSTNEKGEKDPPGGVVLSLGRTNENGIYNGKVRFTVNNKGLEIKEGFSLIAKTPSYARFIGGNWATPEMRNINIDVTKKMVTSIVAMKVMGVTHTRPRTKTIDEVKKGWGKDGIVFKPKPTMDEKKSDLSDKYKPYETEINYLMKKFDRVQLLPAK